MSVVVQRKKAAHVALINVVPRVDYQAHLLELLRVTPDTAESAEDLLLHLRELCTHEAKAKRSFTNHPNLFIAIRKLLTAYGIVVRR